MGAFQGGLTFRQYYVRGDLPADWRDRYAEKIQSFACKGIDPASEEERALGWCSPHFALDVDLDEGMYLRDNYLVLALRVDSLKVPGPQLKLYTEKEARRAMIEQKVETLNRYQRAEIKERVAKDLRSKVLPSIKTFDMVWHLEQKLVRFFTGNKATNEEFLELFEKTFEVGLGADTPYTAAAFGILDVEESVVERLADIQPTLFITDLPARPGFVSDEGADEGGIY